MNYIRVQYGEGSLVARHLGDHDYESITAVVSHGEAESIVKALSSGNIGQSIQTTGSVRVLSPNARARISAAQKKRWATARKGKAVEPAKAKAKGKRKLDPAARARIAAAQKARWAAYRKAKESAA